MAQRYRVLHGVRVAYYNVLAQQRRRAIREQLSKNSADAATTVVELINTGQANRSDSLQRRLNSSAKTNFKWLTGNIAEPGRS